MGPAALHGRGRAGRTRPPDPGYPGFAPFVRGGRVPGLGPSPAGTSGSSTRTRTRARTNEAVLADLENGVTSLWLTVGGAGLPVAALPDVLERRLPGPGRGRAGRRRGVRRRPREQLFALYAEGPAAIPAHEATGNLGADPLGLLARTGTTPAPPSSWPRPPRLAARCAREFPGVRALTVDALPYHDAGASAAQELGLCAGHRGRPTCAS